MFKYKIFPEEKLIVVKVFGTFQLNDIMAWVEALSNDSNFSNGLINWKENLNEY